MTSLEKMQEIQRRFVGVGEVSCSVSLINYCRIHMYIHYWFNGLPLDDLSIYVSGNESYRLDMILKHGLPKMAAA